MGGRNCAGPCPGAWSVTLPQTGAALFRHEMTQSQSMPHRARTLLEVRREAADRRAQRLRAERAEAGPGPDYGAAPAAPVRMIPARRLKQAPSQTSPAGRQGPQPWKEPRREPASPCPPDRSARLQIPGPPSLLSLPSLYLRLPSPSPRCPCRAVSPSAVASA
ncbi:hypothetical protein Slala03_79170 [Streptomyces lavendulae subsp. lavendulae]|nr:hypothetical protein Slala03_79170 [Streptomyces lavendulae subsp. lavendulae]